MNARTTSVMITLTVSTCQDLTAALVIADSSVTDCAATVRYIIIIYYKLLPPAKQRGSVFGRVIRLQELSTAVT